MAELRNISGIGSPDELWITIYKLIRFAEEYELRSATQGWISSNDVKDINKLITLIDGCLHNTHESIMDRRFRKYACFLHKYLADVYRKVAELYDPRDEEGSRKHSRTFCEQLLETMVPDTAIIARWVGWSTDKVYSFLQKLILDAAEIKHFASNSNNPDGTHRPEGPSEVAEAMLAQHCGISQSLFQKILRAEYAGQKRHERCGLPHLALQTEPYFNELWKDLIIKPFALRFNRVFGHDFHDVLRGSSIIRHYLEKHDISVSTKNGDPFPDDFLTTIDYLFEPF